MGRGEFEIGWYADFGAESWIVRITKSNWRGVDKAFYGENTFEEHNMNRRDFVIASGLLGLTLNVPLFGKNRIEVLGMDELLVLTSGWISRARVARYDGRFQIFKNHSYEGDHREKHLRNFAMALVYSTERVDLDKRPQNFYQMSGFVEKYGRTPTMRDARNPEIYVEYTPNRFMVERRPFHGDGMEILSEIRLHLP